jgi:dTDP-4-amino-4,6-dideoxygalactose transaminase
MKEKLAIDGGAPVRTVPFAPWPHYAGDEIEAVQKVLASGLVNYWTGDEARAFEKEFAAYVGVHHAIAVMNGTVALEGALIALGIDPGDDVVVTSRTFVASASVMLLRGARPVFADVDPDSQNVTADSIRAVLTPRTRAIIAVHLAGYPCDMDPIMDLAREHGIKVIEDCAQAHGATYKGRQVGSIGDVGAFSFCQDKILSTGGEGGMVTTNDPRIWSSIWAYKDHGKNYEAVYERHHPPGFRWLHETLGSNWRMTEMQAAIGRELPGLYVPAVTESVGHAWYKFYVFVRPENLREGWDRDRIMAAINAEGIHCSVGSCSEVYLEKAFDSPMNRPDSPLPVARRLGETSLAFQVHPTLSKREMNDICMGLRKVMAWASK